VKGFGNAGGLAAHDHVEDRDAQEAESHHEHAGDGTAPKGNGQCRIDATLCSLSGADVSPHVDVHPNKARCTRENRANGKANSR